MLRFVLHELPDIFGEVDRAALAATAEPRLDDHLPPDFAMHLTDQPLLNALRRHPLRMSVTEWQASSSSSSPLLHVPYVPAFSSRIAEFARQLGWPEGSPFAGMPSSTSHAQRMAAVNHSLSTIAAWRHPRPSEPFLFIMGHWGTAYAFTDPFIRALWQPHHHWFLATVETGSAHYGMRGKSGMHNLGERRVVIPYRAHYLASESAFAPDGSPQSKPKREGVMFHGGLRRADGGIRPGREELAQLARETRLPFSLGNSTIGHVHTIANYSSDARHANNVQHKTMSAMRTALLCLVPAGDTITSRRLFDALACGCVPVLMRKQAYMHSSLPFTSIINWKRIALSIEWPTTRVREVARRLENVAANASLLNALREAGQTTYRSYLSVGRNPAGVSDALLTEMASRSPFRGGGAGGSTS